MPTWEPNAMEKIEAELVRIYEIGKRKVGGEFHAANDIFLRRVLKNEPIGLRMSLVVHVPTRRTFEVRCDNAETLGFFQVIDLCNGVANSLKPELATLKRKRVVLRTIAAEPSDFRTDVLAVDVVRKRTLDGLPGLEWRDSCVIRDASGGSKRVNANQRLGILGVHHWSAIKADVPSG